jgi:hypothetical protein
MSDFLEKLLDTKTHQFLMIFGLIFIAVSLGVYFKWITVEREMNRKLIAIVGIIFLVIGIALSVYPKEDGKCEDWPGYEREFEYSDYSTVGKMIERDQASSKKVHGQFGCDEIEYKRKSGVVVYKNIKFPESADFLLDVTYSKHSPPSVPIEIFIDKEKTPRATINLKDQGDWNKFYTQKTIVLGYVKKGLHSLVFRTSGQDFGVADLDIFRVYCQMSGH